MLIDARPQELIDRIEVVSTLWNSLTARERVLKFHLGISPTVHNQWESLSLTERTTIMETASRLHLDGSYNAPITRMSIEERERVETRK